MTWTIIYKDLDNNTLKTDLIYGIWGVGNAISFAEEKVGCEVVAIVAGDQKVHFNTHNLL